jgi:hypothetical protein
MIVLNDWLSNDNDAYNDDNETIENDTGNNNNLLNYRARKTAAKEWSAVRCVPLEEPTKMLPWRMSVQICAVV